MFWFLKGGTDLVKVTQENRLIGEEVLVVDLL